MIKALSLHPWLNTPAETKRLEAARAAMENWKSLQPRLPSPAQRAPPAPQPPLNNEPAASPHRRANRQRSSGSLRNGFWRSELWRPPPDPETPVRWVQT